MTKQFWRCDVMACAYSQYHSSLCLSVHKPPCKPRSLSRLDKHHISSNPVHSPAPPFALSRHRTIHPSQNVITILTTTVCATHRNSSGHVVVTHSNQIRIIFLRRYPCWHPQQPGRRLSRPTLNPYSTAPFSFISAFKLHSFISDAIFVFPFHDRPPISFTFLRFRLCFALLCVSLILFSQKCSYTV